MNEPLSKCVPCWGKANFPKPWVQYKWLVMKMDPANTRNSCTKTIVVMLGSLILNSSLHHFWQLLKSWLADCTQKPPSLMRWIWGFIQDYDDVEQCLLWNTAFVSWWISLLSRKPQNKPQGFSYRTGLAACKPLCSSHHTLMDTRGKVKFINSSWAAPPRCEW